MNIQVDHVYSIVSKPLKTAILDVMGILKGKTAIVPMKNNLEFSLYLSREQSEW